MENKNENVKSFSASADEDKEVTKADLGTGMKDVESPTCNIVCRDAGISTEFDRDIYDPSVANAKTTGQNSEKGVLVAENLENCAEYDWHMRSNTKPGDDDNVLILCVDKNACKGYEITEHGLHKPDVFQDNSHEIYDASINGMSDINYCAENDTTKFSSEIDSNLVIKNNTAEVIQSLYSVPIYKNLDQYGNISINCDDDKENQKFPLSNSVSYSENGEKCLQLLSHPVKRSTELNASTVSKKMKFGEETENWWVNEFDDAIFSNDDDQANGSPLSWSILNDGNYIKSEALGVAATITPTVNFPTSFSSTLNPSGIKYETENSSRYQDVFESSDSFSRNSTGIFTHLWNSDSESSDGTSTLSSCSLSSEISESDSSEQDMDSSETSSWSEIMLVENQIEINFRLLAQDLRSAIVDETCDPVIMINILERMSQIPLLQLTIIKNADDVRLILLLRDFATTHVFNGHMTTERVYKMISLIRVKAEKLTMKICKILDLNHNIAIDLQIENLEKSFKKNTDEIDIYQITNAEYRMYYKYPLIRNLKPNKERPRFIY